MYNSPTLSARFVEAGSTQIVVSFPDRIHPPTLSGRGWGEDFLTKRGISGVYVNTAKIDWFQSPDFFSAMATIREKVGAGAAITTYGSSMGGYAALLGAKTLRADLSLAVVPQFQIDPSKPPFDTRYTDYAKQTGPFRHDLSSEVSDTCQYCVAYDPTHRLDPKHIELIGQFFPLNRILTYGAGHGVLEHWIESGCFNNLSKFLEGKMSTGQFRKDIRSHRRFSSGYKRRMKNKATNAGHANLVERAFASVYGDQSEPVELSNYQLAQRSKKLLIHAGLPKTGTTSLQAHFFENSKHYAKSGFWYPTDAIERANLNHAWLSQGLKVSDTKQLEETLSSVSPQVDTLMLSDESVYVELPGLTELAYSAFRQATNDWKVEILLFLRNKDDWQRSFYIQSIQNRRGGKLSSRPSARNLWQTSLQGKEFFDQPYVAQLLDFEGMQERIGTALNAQDVHIMDYAKQIDTVSSFCDIVGLDMAKATPRTQRNLSLSDTEAEILRQANALPPKEAWLVKALVEGKFGLNTGKIHQRRLKRAIEPAKQIDWEVFTYSENPPLRLDEQKFWAQLEELRRQSGVLLSYAKQLA